MADEQPPRKRKHVETRPDHLAWKASHPGGHRKRKEDPEVYALPAAPKADFERRTSPPETYGIEAAESAVSFAAANALQRNDGDVIHALRDLGYDVDKMARPAIRALARDVFDPEVMRRLNERLANLQEQKTELLARQVRIAKDGDTEESIRAFAGLARIAGWNAAIKVKSESASVNIHHIMSNPDLLAEALSHFSHEPGQAKALSDARHVPLAPEVEAAIAELEGETADDE